MKPNSLPSLLFLAIASILLSSCQKPSRDNPWDDLAKLDPKEWAPKNLLIEVPNITQRTLSWEYDGDNRIEGYKIDRKRYNQNWVVGYANLNKDSRSFTDTISPVQNSSYYYKVYTYAGLLVSNSLETNAIESFPVPYDLTFTINDPTSLSLSWKYSTIGPKGFKIERKIDQGSWDMHADILNPNQISFTDFGLELSNHEYSYRIYALYKELQSSYTESKFILSIGDFFSGGIVFYLDGLGGGLVCAVSNQSDGAQWGCFSTIIGAKAIGIGEGSANTANIVANCSESGYAALICSNLVLNGYDDWFLPSKDELNLMYLNLKLSNIGNFTGGYYWSSSEFSSQYALLQDFYYGVQTNGFKNETRHVRAVRAF